MHIKSASGCNVKQEQNGLMTYERKFKFDPKKFYEINTKKAAIED